MADHARSLPHPPLWAALAAAARSAGRRLTRAARAVARGLLLLLEGLARTGYGWLGMIGLTAAAYGVDWRLACLVAGLLFLVKDGQTGKRE